MTIRLSLDALTVVDAIARKGSFAAAAEDLHRVPSAITYTVHKLEEDLDVVLFVRVGRRAKLTEAGMELLREGRHLLHAASELQYRVKRVATGWETELRIAVNDLIPLGRVYGLIQEFRATERSTRLRLLREVLGGTWDALASERADLVLGADGEGPAGGGYTARPLGIVNFAFCVAPKHALAAYPEPIPPEEILRYCSISAADSSRQLTPRTTGILSGQDVFTVPDLSAKIEAQCLGLGVGYLPENLITDELASGRLVIKEVEEPKPCTQLFTAWRTTDKGKALKWFVKRLDDEAVKSALLAETS